MICLLLSLKFFRANNPRDAREILAQMDVFPSRLPEQLRRLFTLLPAAFRKQQTAGRQRKCRTLRHRAIEIQSVRASVMPIWRIKLSIGFRPSSLAHFRQ